MTYFRPATSSVARLPKELGCAMRSSPNGRAAPAGATLSAEPLHEARTHSCRLLRNLAGGRSEVGGWRRAAGSHVRAACERNDLCALRACPDLPPSTSNLQPHVTRIRQRGRRRLGELGPALHPPVT